MIESRFDDGRLTIVINQPARLNAISLAMWQALAELLSQARARSDVSVICLRGAGNRAFCSGGDITEYESLSRSAGQAGQAYVGVRQVADLLRAMPFPTVAGISGYCVGAGLVLATACDFRFCATNAVFKVTAVKRGLVYPVAAAAELVALIGLGKTRSILLRGQAMGAVQALSAGLVDAVVELDGFESGLSAFCDELEGQSGDAYAGSKRAIEHALQLGPEDEEMRALNLRALSSAQFLESTRAFIAGELHSEDSKATSAEGKPAKA
jgi:enoyl-CoA hydratase/carnithine racemase